MLIALMPGTVQNPRGNFFLIPINFFDLELASANRSTFSHI
jgi:hypothetical protein